MSSRLADYDYELPEGLIAARPAAERSASRMMVLDVAGRRIEHRRFEEFPEYVREGDLVVLNDTKVIPARAWSDDGRVEFLFLEQGEGNRWTCMVKPGRRLRAGGRTSVGGVAGVVAEVLPDGERVIEFEGAVDLERVGAMPIPPYLGRAAEEADRERYQTVYARAPGAVAAPTAGLHFTPELLGRVPHVFVTLHVGAGTFKPVQTEDIREHRMHGERFELTPETASAINAARRGGGRIFAIGTTVARVLESCAPEEDGSVRAATGTTDIFIRPPYRFRAVDALLTNFHLPKSTLLMLVCAMGGREFVLEAYAEAVREGYRFYSYGDCMLAGHDAPHPQHRR